MLEILEFTFESYGRFWGMSFLLVIVCCSAVAAASSLGPFVVTRKDK